MAHKLYLVVGSMGSYSDYQEWIVAIYRDKEQAETHLKACRKGLEDWIKVGRSSYVYQSPSKPNPYDPDMQAYTDDNKYEIKESTEYLHFDEFQELVPVK